jgi:tight adherence protein B
MQAELADTIALLIGPLRRGVPPATALRAAVDAVGVRGVLRQSFADLLDAAGRGDALADVWLRQAEALDSADLRFVAQAWRLTERTGAPLAQALESAEEVLRERRVSRERLAAMTAGPRASMAVLTALPLAGPMVVAAFGFGPVALYLSSPIAMASVVVGLVLALLGWWGSRVIIEQALRPAVSRGP